MKDTKPPTTGRRLCTSIGTVRSWDWDGHMEPFPSITSMNTAQCDFGLQCVQNPAASLLNPPFSGLRLHCSLAVSFMASRRYFWESLLYAVLLLSGNIQIDSKASRGHCYPVVWPLA
ncbi:unnamed protein product [Natator depressus]